jgi:hypothetical protein
MEECMKPCLKPNVNELTWGNMLGWLGMWYWYMKASMGWDLKTWMWW